MFSRVLDTTMQFSVGTACGTVLFADLRGYTGLAERLAATHIVPLLEEFFAVLSDATELHGGQIFHVAGDGMMAGFGFAESSQAGAHEAFAASRDMLERFTPLAMRWRRKFPNKIGMGIGLHFGEVALGLFGPPRRETVTLVGDTVNIAARLCNRARVGEVLLSASVAAKLSEVPAGGSVAATNANWVPLLRLPPLKLRGRTTPTDVWSMPAPARVAARHAASQPSHHLK